MRQCKRASHPRTVAKTGGHLTTLEIDEGRAKLAQENLREAGVESRVTLERGDALELIPKLEGPFDFVFIDAAKSDYVRYLRMVLPLVPPGGVIVAHNVNDLRSMLEDFIQAVSTNPQLRTTFVNAVTCSSRRTTAPAPSACRT